MYQYREAPTTMTPLLHAEEIVWLRHCLWPWSGASRYGALATQPTPQGGRGYVPEYMRQYQPGDDIRLVDWSATLRMQRAMVRQPQPMRQGTLRFMLDTSESMVIPRRKWHTTMRVVAAIGVMALAQFHRVHMWSPQRSSVYSQVPAWLDDCETWQAATATPPFTLPSHPFEAQPAVLCSDLWHTDWQTTLRRFAAATDQGVCVHLLDYSELVPDVHGEVTLIDSETRQQRTVTIDDTVLARYHTMLHQRLSDIRTLCQQLALHYVLIDTQTDVLHVLSEVTQ